MLTRLLSTSLLKSKPLTHQLWARTAYFSMPKKKLTPEEKLEKEQIQREKSAELWTSIVDTAVKGMKELELASTSAEDRWMKQHMDFLHIRQQTGTAYSGRTESISEKTPISLAWARLNRTMKQNNVRMELRSRERFEKPGEKRRRLKSERWRRRFAEEVKRKIKLANAIRRRGS